MYFPIAIQYSTPFLKNTKRNTVEKKFCNPIEKSNPLQSDWKKCIGPLFRII